MSDFSGSHVDRLTAQPSAADKARRYLTSTGNADLLEVLGLTVEVPEVCPACRNPLPRSGVCRRMRECRTGKSIDKAMAEAMAQDYESGASMHEVARRHEVGETTVRRLLTRLGVTIRNPGGSKRTEDL